LLAHKIRGAFALTRDPGARAGSNSNKPKPITKIITTASTIVRPQLPFLNPAHFITQFSFRRLMSMNNAGPFCVENPH
jgi:hypothetical protein